MTDNKMLSNRRDLARLIEANERLIAQLDATIARCNARSVHAQQLERDIARLCQERMARLQKRRKGRDHDEP